MATVEIPMYTVRCDNCGKHFQTEEHCAWLDEQQAIYQAKESDWLTGEGEYGGYHYCNECFLGWDDNDKAIIKHIDKPIEDLPF